MIKTALKVLGTVVTIGFVGCVGVGVGIAYQNDQNAEELKNHWIDGYLKGFENGKNFKTACSILRQKAESK